jgi:hypothetical protein
VIAVSFAQQASILGAALLGGAHIIMVQPRANIRGPANRLRSGSRKRSKESTGTVRHPYVPFDVAQKVRPTSLRASDTVPTPTAFLSTSFGRYQTLCPVDSFNFEQENTLTLLVITFGGDLARTDCGRLLRMPGFRNCKYDPTYPVTVTYPCDSTSNPDDFRLDIPAANAMLLPHAIRWRKHSDRHTNSEHDWALRPLGGANSCRIQAKLTGTLLPDVASRRGAACKEPYIWGGVHSFCARGAGMIMQSISWRCGNGASHRKNFDTPPLEGNCRETCERSRGTIVASDRWRIPGFREETRAHPRKTWVSGGWSDGPAR